MSSRNYGPNHKGERGVHDTPLALPVSCKEIFSEGLCGLPGTTQGCKRFQLKLQGGVGPFKKRIFAYRYQVRFTKDLKELVSRVEVIPAEPRYVRPSGCHYLVFKFGREFDEAENMCRILSLESGAWVDNKHVPIKQWVYRADTQSQNLDLNDCFGMEIFKEHDLTDTPHGEKSSIADFFRTLLRQHCPKYLGHMEGQEFGLSLCRFERQIAPVAHDYDISFSQVDFSKRVVKYHDDWHLGRMARMGISRVSLLPYFKSFIPEPPDPNRDSGEQAITFLDCFREEFRHSLLSLELDQARLSFSLGEIAGYLLHWYLLRIFILQEDNWEFLQALEEWLERTHLDPETWQEGFTSLVEMKVVLVTCRETYESTVAKLPKNEKERVGAFDWALPFEQVLASLELADGEETLELVLSFLKSEFASGEVRNRRGFAELPMFQNLGWSCSPIINQNTTRGRALPKNKALAGVLATIGRGVVQIKQDSPNLTARRASAEARSHVARSVFPFSHILANWYRKVGIVEYHILPIWETRVNLETRPSIFAHIFEASKHSISVPKTKKVPFNDLLHILLPCGMLIARHLQEQRHLEVREQEKLEVGGFLSHELNKLMSKQYSGVRAEMSKEKVQHPRIEKWLFAWDVVSATASIAYLYSKACITSRHQINRIRERFLPPILAMYQRGVLVNACYKVAQETHMSCFQEMEKGHLPDIEGPIVAPVISYEEYACLSLLIAEPIRNYCGHSKSFETGKHGSWKAFVKDQTLVIKLKDFEQDSVPNSKTIKFLDSFLQAIGVGHAEISWLEQYISFHITIAIELFSRNNVLFNRREL